MTDKHDKLVEMARECGFSLVTNEGYQPTPAKLAAFRDRIVASLCADVEPVGEVVLNYSSQLERCHPDGDMNEVQWLEGSPTPSAGTMLYPATAIASLTAQRDAALARVAELEKDAARYRWLRSVPNAFKAQRIVNDTPHGMDATIDAAMNGGNQ